METIDYKLVYEMFRTGGNSKTSGLDADNLKKAKEVAQVLGRFDYTARTFFSDWIKKGDYHNSKGDLLAILEKGVNECIEVAKVMQQVVNETIEEMDNPMTCEDCQGNAVYSDGDDCEICDGSGTIECDAQYYPEEELNFLTNDYKRINEEQRHGAFGHMILLCLPEEKRDGLITKLKLQTMFPS